MEINREFYTQVLESFSDRKNSMICYSSELFRLQWESDNKDIIKLHFRKFIFSEYEWLFSHNHIEFGKNILLRINNENLVNDIEIKLHFLQWAIDNVIVMEINKEFYAKALKEYQANSPSDLYEIGEFSELFFKAWENFETRAKIKQDAQRFLLENDLFNSNIYIGEDYEGEGGILFVNQSSIRELNKTFLEWAKDNV